MTSDSDLVRYYLWKSIIPSKSIFDFFHHFNLSNKYICLFLNKNQTYSLKKLSFSHLSCCRDVLLGMKSRKREAVDQNNSSWSVLPFCSQDSLPAPTDSDTIYVLALIWKRCIQSCLRATISHIVLGCFKPRLSVCGLIEKSAELPRCSAP